MTNLEFLTCSTRDLNAPIRFSAIQKMIRSKLSKMIVNSSTLNDVSLAVEEAVSNILEHSYHTAETPIIDFEFSISSDKITIIITDEGSFGKTFDLLGQPDLTEEKMRQIIVEKRGGIGLVLMKKIMDEINYETGRETKNRLTLVKHLNIINAEAKHA